MSEFTDLSRVIRERVTSHLTKLAYEWARPLYQMVYTKCDIYGRRCQTAKMGKESLCCWVVSGRADLRSSAQNAIFTGDTSPHAKMGT